MIKKPRSASNRSRRRRAPHHKSGTPSLNRFQVVLFFIMLCFCGMSARLIWVGAVPYDEPPARLIELPEHQPPRGNIYDVNGKLLATSLKAYSVYADPKSIMDVDEAVAAIMRVLPHIDKQKLHKKLNANRRFVWVDRQLTPLKAYQINALGIPGVGFREEYVRVYPNGSLASHVLGAVNVDGHGIAGLEAAYNDALARGENVVTTLNTIVQQQMRETLLETLKESGAKSASAVVMNPKTGSIQAVVSLPDYDPNKYAKAHANAKFNRATKALYEMGSTFKLFTIAKAFEDGEYDLESEIDCTKPLRVGRFYIRDFHAKRRVLTAREVVMYSSNIGAAQMADTLGGDRVRGFMRDLGMTARLTPGIIENARPLLPQRWGRIQTMTVSYGHGIAVTPLHVASGVSAIVSDGIYKPPFLVEPDENHIPQQVIRPDTVEKVREAMHAVVVGGSGRSAQVDGYYIGGKTGTAEVSAEGGYSEDINVASFVGAVPLDNPEMVALIMVEAGKTGYATGGQVAAPAFGRFAERVLPLMGIWPASENDNKNLSERLANEVF